MLDEAAAYPSLETGGDLVGLWSHGDAPTIFLATRPGPSAIRESMYFCQDAESHRAVEKVAWERFGMQVMGLWHSHHRLGLPELSRGDLARTMRYARRFRRRRFVDVLAYRESEWVVKPFVYRDATIGRTEWSRLLVLPGESPLRAAMASTELQGMETFRDARQGPLVPWHAERGAPLWPARAKSEGHMDERVDEDPGPGSGPWRAVDALERLLDQHVPDALKGTMELEVGDEAMMLRLTSGERRLSVGLVHDGALAVRNWNIDGPRPTVGEGGADPARILETAVRTLVEG